MRKSTKYNNSLQFLEQRLALASKDTERLPSLSRLAAECGVSFGTMRRAAAVLRDRGAITMRPGLGIRMGSDAPPDHPQPAPKRQAPQWQVVCNVLSTDLERRTFSEGPLPTAKQLAGRYGCCHRTLRHALDHVAQSGLLVRANRRWVVQTRVASPHSTIVVAVRGTEEGGTVPIGTWAPRNRQQFEALEQYAADVGCRLQFAVFTYEGDRLLGPGRSEFLPSRISTRGDVIGFMVWAQGLDGMDLVGFVRDLERTGKPVAILGTRMLDCFGVLQRDAQCRIFGLGVDARCGELVAGHLLRLGHRRVDYLGTVLPSSRATGLVHAFALAGAPDAVTVLEMSQSDDAMAREAVSEPYRTMLDSLGSTVAHNSLRQQLESESERLVDKTLERAMLDTLAPDILRALRSSRGTALVCENDRLALYALPLLRRLGVRVPEDRSVVGFDDEEEAFLSGLTSYNFNVRALIGAMVDYVLRPASVRRPRDGGMFVLDGFVKQRATTSAPGEPREWLLGRPAQRNS